MDNQSQLNKIYILQIYRAVAAIFVLLFHITSVYKQEADYVLFGNVFGFGYSGVDFFFVLSGFIILYANWGIINQPQQLKTYVGKRFNRIFPIYWVVTTIKLATIFIIPGIAKSYEKDLVLIIKSYLLVPQRNVPIIGAAWSLSYELLFYILFCTFIIWGLRSGFKFMLLWGGLTLALFINKLLGLISIHNNLWLKFAFDERNLEFLLGCLSAYIVIRYKPKYKYFILILGLVLYIISVIFVNNGGPVRSFTLQFGIASFLIVTGSVLVELEGKIKWPKFLVFLGDASYSIYLTHAMFVNIFIIITGWLLVDKYLSIPIYAIIMATFSVLGGSTFYKIIEKPIIMYLRNNQREKLIRLPQFGKAE